MASGSRVPTGGDFNSSLVSLAPDDYLEKTGVTPHLKELMTSVLENRPDNPSVFFAEYFRNLIHGSSSLLKAYKKIKSTKLSSKTCTDNLVAAFSIVVDSKKNSTNVLMKGSDFLKLVQMLSLEYPNDVYRGIVRQFGKDEVDSVSFEEFSSAMETILMYEEYFEEADLIFRQIEVQKSGKIKREDLHTFLETLASKSTSLTLPPLDTLNAVYQSMEFEDNDYLAYEEYLTVWFKAANY
mmetsp:Transcript_42802/g.49202  ORF Transcript_42802/g.49202 Transcript_42802/m.49202 type:complete len:239 (+) Transcript_42802:110-826(+)